MAAISSIALAGTDAALILGQIFQTGAAEARSGSAGIGGTAEHRVASTPRFCTGTILHGAIVNGERVIDEVVVGCEGPEDFVIHCHGNPLLVEQIVSLVQSHGAELVDLERFSSCQGKSKTAIETEAKLAMQKSATLLGMRILRTQIDGGLSAWGRSTLEQIDSLDAEEVKSQCCEILEHSRIAKQIIEGVRIVIAGPPNSGKSTLLNCLAGQQQVIVSDTAGTTRDWVSVTARLGDGALCAEFIDTAGLDEVLAGNDDIEQTAQAMTRKLLELCDLVLYVQDVTQQVAGSRQWTETPVIYVNNKCDLLKSQSSTFSPLSISARSNEGIDPLVQEILKRLGVVSFDVTKPVVFTTRQQHLLADLISADQPPQKLLSDLLYYEDRQ